MAKINEILVEAMLPAIKAVGKAEMKTVIAGIKDHNDPEMYRAMIQGVYANFVLLKQAAYKPKP